MNVPTGSAHDPATNDNVASSQFSRVYDSIRPTLTLSTSSPNPTRFLPISVTAQFSEPVNDFLQNDLTLNNATASGFTQVDSDTYTFDLVPNADGLVTLDVAQNTSQDLAGNFNMPTPQLSLVYDTTPPTLSEITPVINPTNDTTPNYTFNTSET